MTKGLDRHSKGRSQSVPASVGCRPLSQLLIHAACRESPAESAGALLFDHLFDLLEEPVAVVCEQGSLLAANRAWQSLEPLLHQHASACSITATSYLCLLQAVAAKSGCGDAFRSAVLEVAAGRKAGYRQEIGFPSGKERQVFELQALPLSGLEVRAALLILRDVTLCHKLESDGREGHILFQQLLENISNGVFLCDMEGRFIMANNTIASAFGLSVRELVGRTIFEIYKPEMAQTVQEQNLLVLTTGQTLSFELMLETPGGLRSFHVSKSVYKNHRDEAVGVLGICRDVTDRQQVTEALEKSERHFRALIENGGDRVGLLDETGTVIYASPSTKRILGYEMEEIADTDAFLWIHPQDRTAARHRFRELLDHPERVVRAQYRVLHKGGEWKWMEASATNHLHDPAIRAIVLNERDITERKRVEAELVGFSQIIESSNDAIVSTDLDGHIVSWNPAAARIFGYSEKEAFSLHSSSLVTAGGRRQYLQLRQGALRGQGTTDYEIQMLHKSGRRISVSLSISPLRNESRVVSGCAKIIRDITERHRLEREILEISDREKQRLGQDLHDDLCQYLVGISLVSNLLADQLEKEQRAQASEARNIAELARHAVDHARSLARGLSPLRLEEDGLIPQMTLLVSVTERLFRVPCHFEGDENLQVRNFTAATHLYRIMQEALHNAVKHSQASQVCVRLTVEGPNVVLTVADDGVGIGNAHSDADAGDGSGLGMHTMQYRSRVLGATLEIGENPGGGTLVSCSVPRRKLGC